MALSSSATCWLRLITSFARVCTNVAASFSPGGLVCCRSAAWTAVSASRSGRTTWRLRSQVSSRLTPIRRIAAGV
jgi:predicted AAA+ superfamily ATPase